MRRFPRIDANHGVIVDTFRQLGCSVVSLASVGSGCPDIIVGFRRRNLLVEIKDGKKAPSDRKLSSDEKSFFETWKGAACVVISRDEAIVVFNNFLNTPATP